MLAENDRASTPYFVAQAPCPRCSQEISAAWFVIDGHKVRRVLPAGGPGPRTAMWAAGAWPAAAASQTPAAQASGLRAEVHFAILHPLPATLMLKKIDNLLAFLAEAKLQPVTGVFTGNDQEDQDGALVVTCSS